MSEFVNLMSGISGVTVQARDIEGGLHFHLAVPDPFRSDTAQRVELDVRTADLLAAVLREVPACLTALGVTEAEMASTIDRVSRAALMLFRKEEGAAPDDPPREPFTPVNRFIADLAAYIEPERVLAQRFYFSTRKVAAFHRAYQRHLPDGESPHPEQRFLALHQHFRGRDQVVFGPSKLLPGNPPLGEDQWVFVTGEFTLTRDEEALDRIPHVREALNAGDNSNYYNLVTTIFGASDPFFYPYVEFRGRVATRDAVMTASRKHFVLGSDTVTALTWAVRGRPLVVTGFGTLAPTDSGVLHVHPILFRAHPLVQERARC